MNQVKDVLNALIRGGCFLDKDDEPISASAAPFVRLVSPDFAELDAMCVHVYSRAILSKAPDFFEIPNNLAVFESVVGSQAPDRAAIEQLKL